jgi:phosphatidylserine/phosphatidylglycerophosphate/cardiolipin synthase-like enzyme
VLLLTQRGLPGPDRRGDRRPKKRIRVLAYYFTSKPIAEALVEAKRRGVDMRSHRGFVAGEDDLRPHCRFFRRAGVSILIDGEHAVANTR